VAGADRWLVARVSQFDCVSLVLSFPINFLVNSIDVLEAFCFWSSMVLLLLRMKIERKYPELSDFVFYIMVPFSNIKNCQF
jgi:hypothetical protein